jgi:hypothetical protein
VVIWHLAQANVARLVAPIDDVRLADFVAAFDPVYAAADRAPGFIWRLSADTDPDSVTAFDWDASSDAGVIFNMSVWDTIESLEAFIYGADHLRVLRRRREWFERMREAYSACWWIPAGQQPTTDEAEDRVRRLRADGPMPYAFTLRDHFPAPA